MIIRAACNKCGEELYIPQAITDIPTDMTYADLRTITVMVVPCDRCLEAKFQEGREHEQKPEKIY